MIKYSYEHSKKLRRVKSFSQENSQVGLTHLHVIMPFITCRNPPIKLEKDLVREILLAVEASNEDPLGWTELNLEGRETLDVSYHVMLLHEAGLIVGEDLSTDDGLEWLPKRLTYTGHEFLDTVRDAEVWTLTKTGIEKVGSASLSLMLELGKAYGKQVLKERLGIELS